MATKPGLLTDWPWKSLGSFKYVLLAPWAMRTIYTLLMARNEKKEIDCFNLLVIPFLLWRAIHNQIWISYSRYRTAKGNNRILDKSIEFEQVDRETNWDDQILLNGILFFTGHAIFPSASFLPMWRLDGVVITMLLHCGPVEYLYYWLHRALHHHYLYTRYHSHHHSSIVTEPITSVTHPFAEHLAYFLLFAIPTLGTVFTKTASIVSIFGYITYVDLMNNMGHCNFEIVPDWAFGLFPPLKYLMYTPSFHSLHHTQFRTNYSLFMPIYDYVHDTMDKSTDSLHKRSLERREDSPDVVHLTHLTTPESAFHLEVGFASYASRPQDTDGNNNNKWYVRFVIWPLTLGSVLFNFVCARTFVVERNFLEKKLKLQLWAVPRYSMQYSLKWQGQAINELIEEAILDAEAKGAKVVSLALLNQDEELNKSGALYIEKHPKLRTKLADGSSLTVAVVLNSIPKGADEVLFRGRLSKIAYAIVSALCEKGVKVTTFYEYEKLKLSAKSRRKIEVSKNFSQKIWIVGDGLTEHEQLKAPKGTLFIPYSQFPPKKARRDVSYLQTPSMVAPRSIQNLHACENWLPRRVMSATRVSAIVHALEGWDENECGEVLLDVEKTWEAALKHGFLPNYV